MRLHHLAFRTRDLGRLEAFYVGLMGLEVVRRDGTRSVWLRAGEAVLMLEQAESAEPAVPAGSKELVAFAIDNPAPWLRRLADAGIAIEDSTPFTLYLRDPDGRRVALSRYAF